MIRWPKIAVFLILISAASLALAQAPEKGTRGTQIAATGSQGAEGLRGRGGAPGDGGTPGVDSHDGEPGSAGRAGGRGGHGGRGQNVYLTISGTLSISGTGGRLQLGGNPGQAGASGETGETGGSGGNGGFSNRPGWAPGADGTSPHLGIGGHGSTVMGEDGEDAPSFSGGGGGGSSWPNGFTQVMTAGGNGNFGWDSTG